MSITGVSQSAAQSTWSTTAQQRNDAFSTLDQALGSGDLAGAQSALASLQAQAPQGGQSGGQSGSSSDNPMQKDMAALTSALQSGDLAGAQSAFASLKQGMATHKGHHHHGAPPAGPPPATPSTTTASTATPTTSSSSGLDITA